MNVFDAITIIICERTRLYRVSDDLAVMSSRERIKTTGLEHLDFALFRKRLKVFTRNVDSGWPILRETLSVQRNFINEHDDR